MKDKLSYHLPHLAAAARLQGEISGARVLEIGGSLAKRIISSGEMTSYLVNPLNRRV